MRFRASLTVSSGAVLRAVPRAGGWRRSILLGAALPIAYAPFVSLIGDYYEMGSILVSRVVAALVPGFAVDRWRSDDLIKLASNLAAQAGLADVAGLAASLIVGAALAFATYWAGVLVADAMARGRATAPRL